MRVLQYIDALAEAKAGAIVKTNGQIYYYSSGYWYDANHMRANTSKFGSDFEIIVPFNHVDERAVDTVDEVTADNCIAAVEDYCCRIGKSKYKVSWMRDTRRRIKIYQSRKENNVFDAFYTTDLNMFESALDLMESLAIKAQYITPDVNDDDITVVCVCHCGAKTPITVNADLYEKYKNGSGAIQKVFSELSTFEREALLSGMCFDCQSKLFNVPKPGEEKLWGPRVMECEICGSPLYKRNQINGTSDFLCPQCGEKTTCNNKDISDSENMDTVIPSQDADDLFSF